MTLSKTFIKGICLCVTLTTIFSCAEQKTESTGRMDRSRLNIGTYCLQQNARTDKHISEIKECGIDFVICMSNDREQLDIFAKYGVGAIVSGVLPGWWGGDGSNAGTMGTDRTLDTYEEAAKNFEDHPAVWALDIGDEPSAADFPFLGKAFAKSQESMPSSIFPYLNLYPNYASVAQNTEDQTISQLGTKTYAEHISSYCSNIDADYLCYDFYMYALNIPGAFENLCVTSDACRASGKSLWIVLQVNSYDPAVWTSTNRLRFQAYTAMAFGAEVITWACYTAGWWDNQVLDKDGEKTEQYDKLKEVNTELHILSDTYMKYRWLYSSFIGFYGTPWIGESNQASVPAYCGNGIKNLRSEDDSALLVGTMESRDGKGAKALFICAADDPYDTDHRSHTVSFNACGCKSIIITRPDGRCTVLRAVDGKFSFDLESNAAVLMEVR